MAAMRRLSALLFLAAVGCDSGLERPDDVCSTHDEDPDACFEAKDALGQQCAFFYTGDSCENEPEQFGCVGSDHRCSDDDDCGEGQDCVVIEVTSCAPNGSGAVCAACGTTPVGMCFAE
jgi:hypothetical protein